MFWIYPRFRWIVEFIQKFFIYFTYSFINVWNMEKIICKHDFVSRVEFRNGNVVNYFFFFSKFLDWVTGIPRMKMVKQSYIFFFMLYVWCIMLCRNQLKQFHQILMISNCFDVLKLDSNFLVYMVKYHISHTYIKQE